MANQSWLQLLNSARRKAQLQGAQELAQPAHSSQAPQMTDQGSEDQWYDASLSEGDPSPAKKSLSANDVGSVDADFLEEELAKYLPYMPALLSKDLPPCGPTVQVAYDNVNNYLRRTWLSFRGRQSVSDVCRAVKDDFSNQSTLWPAFDRKLSRHRKPWRRELVFYYEVRWIDYFLREAQTPEPMTESELMERTKESSVPKELGLSCDRNDVLQLWDAWHEKKRAWSPDVPGVDTELALKADSQVGVEGKIGKDGNGDSATPADSSEMTILTAAAETEQDIQDELQTGSNDWSHADQD